MSYKLVADVTYRQSRCSRFLVLRTTVNIQKQEF
jgi:hypothetical protein